MARNPDRFLVPESVASWLPSIKAAELPLGKKLLLEAVIELGLKQPKGLFSRRDLSDWLVKYAEDKQAKPLSNARIGQLLKELTAEGAFDSHKITDESINVYILSENLSGFLVKNSEKRIRKSSSTKPNANEIRKEVSYQRQALMASNSVEFFTDSPSHYYGERLMNGILDVAIRTGRNDKRREITTRYALPVSTPKGYTREWIGIQTVCRSNQDSQILELADLAVVYALNSLLVEHIESKFGSDPDVNRIRNFFVFDILDLCHELGYDPKARDIVVSRLRRLRDTVFKIDCSQAEVFRQAFGYEGRDFVEFQYLTEFEIATESIVEDLVQQGDFDSLDALRKDPMYNTSQSQVLDTHQNPQLFEQDGHVLIDVTKKQIVRRKPRFYFVKFNDRHFWALIEQARYHRFLVHDKLKQERLGIVQRFYSWAKAYIGVRPRKPKPEAVQFLMDEFHEVCLPSSEYRTFAADIVKMANKFLVSPPSYTQSNTQEKSRFEQQSLLGGHNEVLESEYLPLSETDGDTLWNEQGLNRSLIHGYYLEIDYREESINQFQRRSSQPLNRRGRRRYCPLLTIYRDTQDPLIGDNSAHNKALRQQKVLAMEDR